MHDELSEYLWRSEQGAYVWLTTKRGDGDLDPTTGYLTAQLPPTPVNQLPRYRNTRQYRPLVE